MSEHCFVADWTHGSVWGNTVEVQHTKPGSRCRDQSSSRWRSPGCDCSRAARLCSDRLRTGRHEPRFESSSHSGSDNLHRQRWGRKHLLSQADYSVHKLVKWKQASVRLLCHFCYLDTVHHRCGKQLSHSLPRCCAAAQRLSPHWPENTARVMNAATRL